MTRRLFRSLAAALPLATLLTLTSVEGVGAAPQPATATDPVKDTALAPHAPGHVIVGFVPGTPADARAAARKAVGARASEPLSRLAPDAEVLTLGKGRSVAGTVNVLRRNPNVRYAEPDYLQQKSVTSNDTYYTNGTLWGMYGDATTPANQWGSQAGEAWAAGHIGSENVYVVVIDEGIDVNHPDLAGNIWSNPFDIAGDGVDNDGNGFIDDTWGWDFVYGDRSVYDTGEDSHGTHVAGTIGGVGGNGTGVAGVNWDVTMISAKFLGPGGGTTTNAVRAVDYATDLKTRHGLDIVATSNSWGGGGFSQALLDAINRGGNAGITFVAAAGNSSANNDAGNYYPSGYQCTNNNTRGWDCVVAVASITNTGALSSFSSYGATTVDIGAPGSSVMSTLPGNTYGSYNGTSMATPHVSGAMALCKSINPALTTRELRQAVMTSAAPTSSLSGRTVTGGRLDVGTMVGQCQPATEPVSGAPTGLTATATSASAIRVNWTDGSTNESYHEVQASTGGCTSFTTVATAGANATSAVVGGLNASTGYCFRVRAGNSFNGGSTTDWTDTASATTFDPPPPYDCAATSYNWIDATTGGTQRSLSDDSSVSVPIEFTFPWYGTDYTTVNVGSNGLLGFGESVTSYSNVGVPSSATPNGIAAVLWDDLNPGAGGQVWTRTLGSIPNRQFVASWNGVPHFSLTGSAVTFQVVLNESNRSVVFQYQDTAFGSTSYDRGASATVGVEDQLGTNGTQVSYNSASRNDLTAVACAQRTSAPSVATASLPPGTVGEVYSSSLTATGGTTPYTWSVASGSLPAGLDLATNGTISGSPTATGTASFTVRVTDANGATADKALSIAVAVPVTVTTSSLPSAMATVAYSATLAASGGQPGYTWSLATGSALPAGLTLAANGTISGTPTTVGTSTFTLVATDAAGRKGSAALGITVAPLQAIEVWPSAMDVRLNTNRSGTAGTATITVISADGTVSGLPVSGTWTITGFASSTASGTTSSTGSVTITSPRFKTANGARFEFCLNGVTGSTHRLATGSHCASRLMTAALAVSTSTLPSASADSAYSVQLAATGGDTTNGYTWSAVSGLPTGLVVSSTGVLSGTPTVPGTYSVTVQVADSGSPALTATRTLSLTVGAPAIVVRVASVTVATNTTTKGTAGTATVTVVDAGGNRVGSVAVSGRWTIGTSVTNASGTTGSTGVATITSPRVRSGTVYQFCVTGLSRSGYVFDGTERCGQPGQPWPSA